MDKLVKGPKINTLICNLIKSLLGLLIMILVLVNCDSEIETGYDYDLFRNSPVWNLAKAVKKEDVEKIRSIIREQKINIDYQEPKYGETLLMLSILNAQYDSFKTLLEEGANPNIYEKFDGASAIILACGLTESSFVNDKFLKLLIKYGANPNDVEVGERRKGNYSRNTPLIRACGCVNRNSFPLSKVKILVDAGANIDYINDFNQSALSQAILLDNLDIVLYLLEKGANYNIIIHTVDGKDYYLWDELRYILLPLNSKDYQTKLKIVEFLKKLGIDYEKIPIPEYAIERAKKLYPNSWKEYLDKY